MGHARHRAARTDDTTTQVHLGRCVGHQSSSYAAAATVRSMQRSNDRNFKMDCFGPVRDPWKAGCDARSGSSRAFILPADSDHLSRRLTSPETACPVGTSRSRLVPFGTSIPDMGCNSRRLQ